MGKGIDLVGKIGSMALIDKENQSLNYNLFARLSRELRPGYVWVTSGATEIGRLDYMRRTGKEIQGNMDDIKADYAAEGQAILMQTYRQFIDSKYVVRQILVEHQHFNDPQKTAFLKALIQRAPEQNAIPIINYNDAVSSEENRKNEIRLLETKEKKAVECADNDETAAQTALMLEAKTLLILTGSEGIYRDASNPDTVIEKITASSPEALSEQIEHAKSYCSGASRKGANGAKAKLEYIKEPALRGTTVIIANAKHSIADILGGKAVATRIGLNL